ncbi:flavodoxin family protein [Crassaminicella thermophila]|uniref:Flavodoxin family protein n=1 Tax=Crassaminicella thermophila TaxID=2599308 RepID=A0A5C0SDT5_CRATE|nr:flavodoxin family protein [Crassaminicella thermophila]QEK11936.1 flavodoxin family protein [Crassaminicella thermophila]
MKALVILGSPRNKMNTDIILNKVIEGLEHKKVFVEKIELKKLNIKPCISCYACAKTGICYIKDDMQKIYDKFDKADIVVVASPLYFNSVTSITKTMIDRCQVFWSSKYVLNNPSIDRYKKRMGMFICTAGGVQKENGYLGATLVMDLFFKAINTEYKYNFLIDHTDDVFVKDRPDVLKKAFEMGKKLAEI